MRHATYLGLLMAGLLMMAAPAHARVLSAYGGGSGQYLSSYGGSGYGQYYSPSGGYVSYGGPGGGVDAPTRGLWEARMREAVRQAYTPLPAPCGAYGRAPLGCRLVTTRYQPMIHGE
jgi:hypothetical protein